MKKHIYSTEGHFYHVTGRCSDSLWSTESLFDVWELFGNTLNNAETAQNISTHAFVMMSNHYHWLCSSSKPLDKLKEEVEWLQEAYAFDFLHEFQFETHILKGLKPEPLFNTPPKVIKIDHIEAYRKTYAYIYKNPVTAGIVAKAEDYPFSTLYYLLGKGSHKLNFNCWDQMNTLTDPGRVIRYINC